MEPIRVTPPIRSAIDPVEAWFFTVLRIFGFILLLRGLYIWFSTTGLLGSIAPSYVLTMSSDLEFWLMIGTGVICMIAGVGLWLLAPWGAVLWLALVFADAILFSLVDELEALRPFIMMLNAGLVSIYLGMALMVRRRSRERERI